MPATRQSAARKNIAASEKRSVSCACSAAGVRGRPRKVTPNAFTKQAAASAAESAKQRAHRRHQELQSPLTAVAG